MTKRGSERQHSTPTYKTKKENKENEKEKFGWIPLWGWVLIFTLPLVLSLFMFWRVGRIPSMILFPIAWVGFWYALLERSDWKILKNVRKRKEPASDDNG